MNTAGTVLTAMLVVAVSVCMQAQPSHLWSFGIGAPTPTANTSAEDLGHDLVTDASGNVYVCGAFKDTVNFNPAGSNILASDMSHTGFVAKYDANGALLWAFKIGDVELDYARGIALDKNSNLYVAGFFGDTVDFDPGTGVASLISAGSTDIFLAKYSSAGAYLWAVSIGGSGADFGHDVCVDDSNNVIVAGNYFAKYSTSGAIIWTKQISNAIIFEVAAEAGGNFCLLGGFSGTADLDAGPGTSIFTAGGSQDIFAARYNSSGYHIWSFPIWGGGMDVPRDISVVGTDIYIAGTFQSQIDIDPSATSYPLISNGSFDFFVAKYDTAKTLLWGFGLGSLTSDLVHGMKINGNKVAITGVFSSAMDFDPDALSSKILTTNGGNDIFVGFYLTSNGTFTDVFNIGGNGTDVGTALDVNGSDLYLTGYFGQSVNFDPGSGTAISTSNGGSDIFVAKYALPCEISATSSSNAICAGSAVTLSTDATTNVLWSTGSNSTSITVTPTINTSYTVSGSANSGTNSCTSTVVITVSVNPVPNLSVTANKLSVCKGQSITLTASNVAQYSWTGGSNSNSIVVTAASPTVLSYTVTGTNQFGCSKQAAITVTFTQCAGMPEPDKFEVVVWPNPSGGKFTVTLNQQIRSGSVQVFNGEGKLVLEKIIRSEHFELDLGTLPVGVYLLRLQDDSRTSYYQKLIKTE